MDSLEPPKGLVFVHPKSKIQHWDNSHRSKFLG